MDEIKTCPYLKKCGACSSMGKAYEETLRSKEARIRTLLRNHVIPEGIEGMNNPYHYRNKIHRVCAFERKGRKEEMKTGIYAEGTHSLIPVRNCLIEDEAGESILKDVEQLTRDFKIPYYDEDSGRGLLRHILIRTAHETGEILLVLVLAGREFPGKKHFVRKLREMHPEITSLVFNVNNRHTNMILGDQETVVYGPGYITDVLCGRKFRISPRSFYQVNSLMTEKIYSKAVEYADLSGREKVIDAYCGIGTIGIAASDRAGEVLGVESNRQAVKDAKTNAELNGIRNIRFTAQDAGAYMMKMAAEGEHADVLFMDPPRGGSTVEFIDAACSMAPRKIIYISCNPETLSRDLAEFERRGYAAKKAKAFDAFCWTAHTEAVTLIEPRGLRK